MTVLVDPARWPGHGRLWAHLVSDSSYQELHAFAAAAGLPSGAFEGDHYDVPAERCDAVVALGARPVSARELLERLVASGLRRPKRRGERVLASAPVGAGRVDVVLSGLGVPGERTTGATLLLAGDQRLVRVSPAAARAALLRGATPVGHLRHHRAADAPARDWTYHAVLRAGPGRYHPLAAGGAATPDPGDGPLLELLLARLRDRSS